jgi:hypothetical protein
LQRFFCGLAETKQRGAEKKRYRAIATQLQEN